MPLRLDSRPVGDVLVVRCQGRIVAGGEVFSLHSHIGDALPKYGDVVLQLEEVEFLDSSGLGALVRLISTARSKGGDIKLCGVPEQVRKTLQLTNLLSLFETYNSEAEAITAAYLGSRYSKDKSDDPRSRILCVYDSVDVRTFLREVLCRAGYNVLTTAHVEDARILLKATKAKLILLGANMQVVHGKSSQKAFEEIDPSVSLLVLEEDFAKLDPGEATVRLLENIRSRTEKTA